MSDVKKQLPRIGTSDSSAQYDMGDQVYVDFGDAGRLGPGPISAKLEYDDGWTGYCVLLSVSQHDEMEFGWVGSDMIVPADGSNEAKRLLK